jgi:hypothetical protein
MAKEPLGKWITAWIGWRVASSNKLNALQCNPLLIAWSVKAVLKEKSASVFSLMIACL